MNRTQKLAWWVVAWISAGFAACAIAVLVLYFKAGMPKALAGMGFMGIAGCGGIGPLIFKKDKDKITCDERDRQINSRAALAGFMASYLVTGLACMLPFFILGHKATISVIWLPMIFMITGLASFFVHAVTILILYGRGNDRADE